VLAGAVAPRTDTIIKNGPNNYFEGRENLLKNGTLYGRLQLSELDRKFSEIGLALDGNVNWQMTEDN